MAVQVRVFAVLAHPIRLLVLTAIRAIRQVKTIAELKLPDAIEPLWRTADGAHARLLAAEEQEPALIHRRRAEEQLVQVQPPATRKPA